MIYVRSEGADLCGLIEQRSSTSSKCWNKFKASHDRNYINPITICCVSEWPCPLQKVTLMCMWASHLVHRGMTKGCLDQNSVNLVLAFFWITVRLINCEMCWRFKSETWRIHLRNVCRIVPDINFRGLVQYILGQIMTHQCINSIYSIYGVFMNFFILVFMCISDLHSQPFWWIYLYNTHHHKNKFVILREFSPTYQFQKYFCYGLTKQTSFSLEICILSHKQ